MALILPIEDSLQTESSEDSVFLQPEPVYGILLSPPADPEPAGLRPEGSNGISFILTGMFLLFLVIALRFRNNFKYLLAIFRNLVETRTRQNVFDDTLRETSLIVLLNLLWCVCAGIVGYCVFDYFVAPDSGSGLTATGMLWGMAVAAVYSLFMWAMYASVGWIFSDRSHAELWVKGFTASQALMAPAFFITSLIGICNPETALWVGIMSAAVFIFAKLAFIWKGYMIFFNQFSSWVLFLCYLCSLEIVPLILCYRCANLLGRGL